jgi:NADH-quinone oxidoreductase subunit G
MQRFGSLKVARIGVADDQTYKIEELGNDIGVLQEIVTGKHKFVEQLKQAKHPVIIIGDGIYSREDSFAILALVDELLRRYNADFNMLHNHASMVGSLDIGFTPQKNGKNTSEILENTSDGTIKLVYLLGADEINMAKLEKTFVVYQGHHGDAGANIADVIFPGSAYTEKNATYVNLEGRAQIARRAVLPPGQAKDDWLIIKDLANKLGISFNLTNLEQIRVEMAEYSNVFKNIDSIIENNVVKFVSDEKIINQLIDPVTINYYMTDSISRASITMAKCSQAKRDQENAA